MTYVLTRESDGAGDSGPMSKRLWYGDIEKTKSDLDPRPIVGAGIMVGSLIARTYQRQDYWQTTEVLEILEESEIHVKFRTRNSIYTWKIS